MTATPDLPPKDSARLLGLTRGQAWTVAGMIWAMLSVAAVAPFEGLVGLTLGLWFLFSIAGLWRLVLILVGVSPAFDTPPHTVLPRYTVIAALRDEAAMVPQIVSRLSRLDYPSDRLQGFLALDADDVATITAAERAARPEWLEVLVVPLGVPTTKPRALNHALMLATGDLVTVYDAEDEPSPGQLREAAARFAKAGADLACLQAPLRIRRVKQSRTPFLDRQFAAEYAALFEVILPAYARLGLPFPLGGTSNHFRTDVLRAIGGWDAFNVTEDADLGFRLWRRGYRLGVLRQPTWESPPGSLDRWLPQRTRWLKGFMQTWGVQMRAPLGLGWRGQLALQATMGQAIVSAALYAPALFGVGLLCAYSVSVGELIVPAPALAVLTWGAALAWGSCWLGAKRAGVPYGPADMLLAPVYWSLLTLAFAHAAWRLVRQPHAWDKTQHTPDIPTLDAARPDA